MREYVTSQGDVWDLIAHKLYGHEPYMWQLIEANPHLRHTVVFDSGIVLQVPDLEEPIEALDRPPWETDDWDVGDDE